MKQRLLPLAIALIAFLSYANNLSNDFAMDDHYNVVINHEIRSLANVPTFFTQAWGASATDDYEQTINRAYWRPLVLTSFALSYALFGDQPWAFHLPQNLAHAGLSLLLFCIFRRLTGNALAAALGAALFAVHPVHTEAVNIISYTTTVYTALFAAAGIWAYLRVESPWRRAAWVALAYAAALASKETAVTLPGWLILLELLHSDRPLRQRAASIAPTIAATSAVLIAYFAIRHALLAAQSPIDFFAGFEGADMPAIMSGVYALYARLLVWPWPLTPFYDLTLLQPTGSFDDPAAALGLLLFVSTLAAIVLFRRRAPLIALGLGWWLLGLVAFSHLVPLPVGAAERFLYLPSVGICLVAAAAWHHLAPARATPRRIALVVCAVILAICAAATLVRNQAFRSNTTLLETTVAHHPGSFNAHMGLGQLYYRQFRYSEAACEFEAAAQLLPVLAADQYWITALIDAGRIDDAWSALTDAEARHGPLRVLRQRLLETR